MPAHGSTPRGGRVMVWVLAPADFPKFPLNISVFGPGACEGVSLHCPPQKNRPPWGDALGKALSAPRGGGVGVEAPAHEPPPPGLPPQKPGWGSRRATPPRQTAPRRTTAAEAARHLPVGHWKPGRSMEVTCGWRDRPPNEAGRVWGVGKGVAWVEGRILDPFFVCRSPYSDLSG